MYQISCSNPQFPGAQTCKRILVFFWISGLLLGAYAAAGAGDSFLLTTRGDVSTVSIPGLLITGLPYLLTAIAVFLPHPGFLIPVVLWRAFAFAFSAYGLGLVYHGASWLIRLLLMFHQIGTVPLLMWLWLEKCDRTDLIGSGKLAAFGAAAALVGVINICVVSPFAAALL